MASHRLLRNFMADELSLRQYMANKEVNAMQLHNNLVQCAYQANSFVPEHYFQAWGQMAFQDVTKRFPELITYFQTLLPSFADYYLTFDASGDEICVKKQKWNEWQLVARAFSPSVMKIFFLFRKNQENGFEPSNEFWRKNFQYTALPTSEDSDLQTKRSSLRDLHVHAGSSLEADIAWLNLLFDSKFFIADREKWTEDLKTNGMVQSRMDMYRWALRSRRLIQKMKDSLDGIQSNLTLENSLWHINHGVCSTCSVNSWFLPRGNELINEAEFLWKVLTHLSKDHLAYWLHYYLLIKGLFRNFLTVQSSQYGLEQFNRTLHAPYRGGSMDYLHQSLKQMVGNDLSGARSLELRVAPASLKSLGTLQRAVASLYHVQSTFKTKVSFVCHLVKSRRADYQNQRKKVNEHLPHLVGVDVTGSDFIASPGVFIDVFKDIRGGENETIDFPRTYHAGEDFFHLLDGMRMVWEAVEILHFKAGDRIGHASAAGVDPKLWHDNLGGILPIARGRYFDNLMFAIYLCHRNQIYVSHQTWGKLLRKARELSIQLGLSIVDIHQIGLNEWMDKRKQCQVYESSAIYKHIIEVGCYDVFSRDELIRIQQALLKELKEKGIAIESTPTSNVTIGHHHSFCSYHLLTWLKWKKEGLDIPDIVLGSDETGVFPVNIANEYANVFELLEQDGELDAKAQIEDLIAASNTHQFQKYPNKGKAVS